MFFLWQTIEKFGHSQNSDYYRYINGLDFHKHLSDYNIAHWLFTE